MACRYGMMARGMKGFGKTTRLRARVATGTHMETSMMASLKMIKLTVMGYISMRTALNMRASGSTISRKARVKRSKTMGESILGRLSRAKNMAMECLSGLTGLNIKGNGFSTKFKGMVHTLGLREESTQDIG